MERARDRLAGDDHGGRRWLAFTSAARHDLWDAGGWLVVGAAAAATLQVLVPRSWLLAVAGFPNGGPLRQRQGTVIDQVDGSQLDDTGDVLRINARVEHGNSGGPLLDSTGRVAGVVYAKQTATGYGLAVPVSSLKRLLDDYDKPERQSPAMRHLRLRGCSGTSWWRRGAGIEALVAWDGW